MAIRRVRMIFIPNGRTSLLARTLAGLLLLITATIPGQADGSPPASPAPAEVVGTCCQPPPLWTGIYIGLQAGGMWSDGHSTSPFPQAFGAGVGQELSPSSSGGLLGGHLGYNYQFGHFLIGAEVAVVAANPRTASANVLADQLTLGMDDLVTLTGRLGVVVKDQFLFYTKGGFASSSLELHAASATLPVTANISQRESGWTVGAGIESRMVSNLLFGLEYNYISLPNQSFAAVTGGAIPNVPVQLNLDGLHAHTATARLSILFGPGACCREGLLGKY